MAIQTGKLLFRNRSYYSSAIGSCPCFISLCYGFHCQLAVRLLLLFPAVSTASLSPPARQRAEWRARLSGTVDGRLVAGELPSRWDRVTLWLPATALDIALRNAVCRRVAPCTNPRLKHAGAPNLGGALVAKKIFFRFFFHHVVTSPALNETSEAGSPLPKVGRGRMRFSRVCVCRVCI
jgi:hypothetical protein